MRTAALRILQTVTAGAVVFALLGACGLPINHPQRRRPPQVRPIVVRLTGTWEAVPIGGEAFRPLLLRLHHAGAMVDGVLHLPDRDLPAVHPGRIDRAGQFTLVFGHSPDQVRISFQISARPLQLTGTLEDGGGREPVRFVRR